MIAVGVMAIGADLLFRLLEKQVGVKGTVRSSRMAVNPTLPKGA